MQHRRVFRRLSSAIFSISVLAACVPSSNLDNGSGSEALSVAVQNGQVPACVGNAGADGWRELYFYTNGDLSNSPFKVAEDLSFTQVTSSGVLTSVGKDPGGSSLKVFEVQNAIAHGYYMDNAYVDVSIPQNGTTTERKYQVVNNAGNYAVYDITSGTDIRKITPFACNTVASTAPVVSSASQQLVDEVNRYRAAAGLGALTVDPGLTNFSQYSVNDILTGAHNYFNANGSATGIAMRENLGMSSSMATTVSLWYAEGPGGGHYDAMMDRSAVYGGGTISGMNVSMEFAPQPLRTAPWGQ